MWEQRVFGNERGICGIVSEPDDRRRDKDLVIALAGLAQPMSEKNDVFTDLRKMATEKNCHFVQFDYYGHGDSRGDFHEVNYSTMAYDARLVAKKMIHEIAPARIIFVANGLGGLIAYDTARYLARSNKKLPFCLILISVPVLRASHYGTLFSERGIEWLRTYGRADMKSLVPGNDYALFSDFSLKQLEYFWELGSHIMNLHGLEISLEFLKQLDRIDARGALDSYSHGRKYLIYGDKSGQSSLYNDISVSSKCLLQDVDYFYERCETKDTLINYVDWAIGNNRKFAFR
ncbi:hypothetical protein [Cohnella soli]|uniref:Serine aminopeptidase S33 domain-containing protein n=1 Tax=Cohnella soli TaxID=425005 RepID=A0ABW0I4B3_9BACL